MTSQSRVRLARRYAGLSQAQLALAVGVQRSAVSHWESALGKNPTLLHLREIALVTEVQFEWLATGRGEVALCNKVRLDSIATAKALLIVDVLELRLLAAFRHAPPKSQIPLVELTEQLAALRTGRGRDRSGSYDDAALHGSRGARQSGHRTGHVKLG